MVWLEFWVPTLTAIGSIATAIIAGVLVSTLRSQKKQLLVSNFEKIIDYIGSELSRKNRRIIYNSQNSMKKLLEKYPDIDDEKLMELQEASKQVCAVYDRVGFLLKQDKTLEEKIVEWHGFTTGIMWKILEPIREKWKEKDKALDYQGFDFVGDKSYCVYKNEIKDYIKNRAERK